MGEIRPKKCEGRELTKDQLAEEAEAAATAAAAAADEAEDDALEAALGGS